MRSLIWRQEAAETIGWGRGGGGGGGVPKNK